VRRPANQPLQLGSLILETILPYATESLANQRVNQRVDFSFQRSYNGYMEEDPMEMVGIKELKNKLTYYLKLTKEGNKVIVTDRGTPVAIIQSIDRIKNNAGIEERLASLAKRGMLRLPRKKGKLPPFKSVKATGKPASEIIIEDRR